MTRSRELQIADDMSVQCRMEPGKVIVLVLDGQQGKARITEAVEQGFTIIETAKGKEARIKFEESELF